MYYYSVNYWFHATMDFDFVFEKLKNCLFSTKEEFFEKTKIDPSEKMFYFPVLPDDKTIGYNLLIGLTAKGEYYVKYAYSLEANLGLEPCLGITKEQIFKTITNASTTIPFSKFCIESWEEFGTIYCWKLKDKNLKNKWREMGNKYIG